MPDLRTAAKSQLRRRLAHRPTPLRAASGPEPIRVLAPLHKSKLLRDAGLSQHRVGGVPGQNLPVHRETPLRDWTVPDFMVTFARPLKVTSVRTENLLDAPGVTGHQKVRTPLSSCWYSMWKLAVPSLGTPFNSNNSGIRALSF